MKKKNLKKNLDSRELIPLLISDFFPIFFQTHKMQQFNNRISIFIFTQYIEFAFFNMENVHKV